MKGDYSYKNRGKGSEIEELAKYFNWKCVLIVLFLIFAIPITIEQLFFKNSSNSDSKSIIIEKDFDHEYNQLVISKEYNNYEWTSQNINYNVQYLYFNYLFNLNNNLIIKAIQNIIYNLYKIECNYFQNIEFKTQKFDDLVFKSIKNEYCKK